MKISLDTLIECKLMLTNKKKEYETLSKENPTWQTYKIRLEDTNKALEEIQFNINNLIK